MLLNVAGVSLSSTAKRSVISLNGNGIFNQAFLRNADELILTDSPLTALAMIRNDQPTATFLLGPEQKYVSFVQEHGIKRVILTFEGATRMATELAKNGVSVRRVRLDPEMLTRPDAKALLHQLLSAPVGAEGSDDTVQEIEGGFLFRFPHLSYRVIGSFFDFGVTTMKASAKAFTETEVFVDALDLYRNRDRQTFVYNLMDRFSLRDQVQLEADLTQIIQVIEKHREKHAASRKRTRVELADHQKDIGMRLLTSPRLLDEIDEDYSRMGYVRERKNKLLLYLIMSSRLTDSPLHGIIVSRSAAGKSQLVELTEELCPPEDVESISELSAQALYYFGREDLKNKFIVIGEKQGSEGSDYPLRELISRKSITKAIPMKDPVSGQIRTVSIRVEGPIALVETTTNGELNPENLSRCFIIGIDESEEQTQLIHQAQRKSYTLERYLERREIEKVVEKHVYAQRLLRKVLVFNPYANLLTFPTSKLKTRRDNDKFLRLISVICFLFQHQRKLQRKKLSQTEIVEYIECTPEDYRLAFELLSDGVLDSTLDDLPRTARKLLELTKQYLKERSAREGTPMERIVFERKDIREYSSWSFAQVRNSFRVLRDYEYIQLVKAKNGVANQYKLNGGYQDADALMSILTPDELERRLKQRPA